MLVIIENIPRQSHKRKAEEVSTTPNTQLSVTMLCDNLQFNISNLYTVAKRSGHTGS